MTKTKIDEKLIAHAMLHITLAKQYFFLLDVNI